MKKNVVIWIKNGKWKTIYGKCMLGNLIHQKNMYIIYQPGQLGSSASASVAISPLTLWMMRMGREENGHRRTLQRWKKCGKLGKTK